MAARADLVAVLADERARVLVAVRLRVCRMRLRADLFFFGMCRL
jgi:hypothetical protein